MSAPIETENPVPLTKVDSAIAGLSSSPTDKKISHRRTSSSASGIWRPEDLKENGQAIEIAPETQQLGWRMNKPASSADCDPTILKKFLCTPPVKKMDLVFPLGMTVTARNLKGVTIKDAMDAIYKAYKKKSDDELSEPYLKGFEWDKEESWTQFKIHAKKEAGGSASVAATSKKAKKKEEKELAKATAAAE